MHLSFALSITHFFSSVGADAGFAALVGLAILVLLHFAHARETSTLRDQLAAAMQRIEELERRLAGGAAPSIGARQPVGTAAPSTAPAPAPPAAASASGPAPAPASPDPAGPSSAPAGASSAPAGGGPPSVAPPVSARPLSAPPAVPPAGMAAPPLNDATRVVPLGEPAGDSAVLADDPASVSNRASGDGLGGTPSPIPGKTPSPVTAAAGGNGFSAARATGGLAGTPRSLLEHGLPGQGRSLRWIIPVLAVVLIAVIAVVLVLALHPGSSHHKAAVHRHHVANIAPAPPGVAPSSVTVAVVNGTNINQLAHHVADRLTGQSFKEGTLATDTNQSLAKSTIGFLPGQRNDALAVAHALKLPASVVHPATQSSEGMVCPTASSCTDDVIVLVGSNLAPKR